MAEAILLQRRVTLWLFEQLLRDGIVPFEPVSAGGAIDATIRCLDGTYRDLIIRPSYDEHFPLAFRVESLAPRPRLVVVCVAWAVSPIQAWVLPSIDFAREASEDGGVWTLDL